MKRSTRTAAVGLAAATLSLGVTAPGVAGTSTTHHGSYDGVTIYTPRPGSEGSCDTTPKEVSGNWNVRIAGDRATMSTNLFYDGQHHLAYGGPFEVLSASTNGTQFQIQGATSSEDGTPITITLTLEDGVLSYRVAPYPLFGNDCASLTLTGHGGTPAVP
jgi:hypothetical protein